ncbi:MAG: serine/threonine-protein kinase [Gemmatimonadota bacterium]
MRDALRERYAVDGEIGRGGMAVVCRARDLRYDRLVAIKVLFPDLARAVAGERFLREIGILARLSHPNILPLLDSGSVEVAPGLDVPWYVMPYVAEETLRARLDREGPLPLELALRYTREICAALAHAHAQGFIHRDIKPENILLSGDQAVLADFGIARAVTVAGGTTLSSTGLVVGTPAYMSPEQSMGSDRVDGRSDLYSLGCVLYEMLGGHPPFTGSTPQAISARHQFEPPPPIRVVRPTIPDPLAEALEKVLAKSPADRYPGAGIFAQSLEGVLDPALVGRSHTNRRLRRFYVTVALAVVATAGGSWVWRHHGPELDTGKYAVLPLQAEGVDPQGLLSSTNSARLLWEGLRRWTDVRMVDPMAVPRGVGQITSPPNLDAAREVARSLGAGRFIWGSVYPLGDSIAVRASIYDAAGSGTDPIESGGIQVAKADLGLSAGSAEPVIASFRRLAQALLVPEMGKRSDAAEFDQATTVATLRATLSGDSALERFDLEKAKQLYAEALRADSSNPAAMLRVSRVALLLNEPLGTWGLLARRLASRQQALPPGDRSEARALAAFAERDLPRTCDEYRTMVRADSGSFFGWYGLGICQVRDDAVVPDGRSASGWRFRSSYAQGMKALARALKIAPLSHAAFGGYAVDQLAELLYAEPNRLRRGWPEGDSSKALAAYPGVMGDTISFLPYPMGEVLLGQHLPASRLEAVGSSRRLLLDVTSTWLTDFPNSIPALKAQAVALELAGLLTDSASGGGRERSALAIVDRLRRALPDDIELGSRRARILLKLGRFREVRSLADSLLRLTPRNTDEREILAALAGLTGRPMLAADILGGGDQSWDVRDPEGRVLDVPVIQKADAQRLLAFAAAGEPAESIRAIAARIGARASRGANSAKATAALLYRPRLIAFPLLGAPEGTDYHAQVEQAIERGDTTTAKHLLGELAGFRERSEPGTRSWDAVALESRLSLLIGDSSAVNPNIDDAVRHIDRSERWSTADVAEAAGILEVLRGSRRPQQNKAAGNPWAQAVDDLTIVFGH